MPEQAWIEVYPFQGRNLNISDTGKRIKLNPELSDYCDKSWKPKAEKGWKSSWISFAGDVYFTDSEVNVNSGAMPFSQVDGIVKAIEKEEYFARGHKYSNCLSVGFLTATKDDKIIFQRRAPDVHVPNTLIHEPCGYMASMYFAPRAECDDPKYANDSRLFDLETQLNAKKKQIAETFGLSAEQVSYGLKQDFLATGWLSKEMYFSTTGKIDAKQKDLNMPEKGEFVFVPFKFLKDLIHNQGKLSKVSPENYRPSDVREMPLIDESLIGLIFGYEKLTGEKLDINETIDRLSQDGLSIKVYDTSPGKGYGFPTFF